MGLMTVGSLEDYKTAIRRLLPRGDFWERQLADPESDASLWCDAEAEELRRLELRRAALVEESCSSSTTELIDEWERASGVDHRTLALDVRRRLLREGQTPNLNPNVLQVVASAFGASIVKIDQPFRPATFGYTRFSSRLSTPAAWNVIYLYVDLPDIAIRNAFKSSLESVLLASYTTLFFFRTANNEYVSG